MMLLSVIGLWLISTCLGDIVLEERGYLKLPDRNGIFNVNNGVGKESAYDEVEKLLYVIGSSTQILQIVDINSIDTPSIVFSATFSVTTDGDPLDVQICKSQTKSIFAISFGERDVSRQGHVVFYSSYKRGDTALKPMYIPDQKIAVGNNPDNIKFTSDCSKLVVSNEGIPAVVDGNFIDPPGSISIITVTDTGNPPVATVLFTQYDTQAETDRLLGIGIRYMVRVNPSSLLQNPISNNLEPEYIAISPNNAYAYITLQENNAILKIDLSQSSISDIFPMGYKEFEFSTLDVSDNDTFPGIHMGRRRIRALYQPDKITFMDWGGKLYLVTADEGKLFGVPTLGVKDYGRGRDLENSYDVDPTLLTELLDNSQLGRVFISTADRISLSDKIKDIYIFGGRGFSIFDASTLERQWESGDTIEKFSRWYYPDVFNSGYSVPNETPTGSRDYRSPNMGPELNSLAVGTFKGRTVMFFGSGQNGQIYIYQLQASVPSRVEPEFQSIHRRGVTDRTWAELYSSGEIGDIGITDITFVDEAISPATGSPLVIVVSEISGSVSLYTLTDSQYPTNICNQPTFRDTINNIIHHKPRRTFF